MVSKIVKAFVFVVAALAAIGNVHCIPARTFKFFTVNNHIGANYLPRKLYPIVTNDWDTDRIAGGQIAKQHQFPFMAVVHRLIGRGQISQCGGSIINSRWVLTAGHCVDPSPRRFLVVFGINDKTQIGYDTYRGPGVSMITTQAFVHPQYSVTANDIALLRMPRDIPFGPTIQPIQLAGLQSGRETFANKMSMVIGWGKDGPAGSGTKMLKYATLPIAPNDLCRRYWGVTDKHVCTAPGRGQDACQGDSGGPMIVLENDKPLQVGIVSYGDGNCPSGKPGVFTRVTSYDSWIQSIINRY